MKPRGIRKVEDEKSSVVGQELLKTTLMMSNPESAGKKNNIFGDTTLAKRPHGPHATRGSFGENANAISKGVLPLHRKIPGTDDTENVLEM